MNLALADRDSPVCALCFVVICWIENIL